MNFEVARLDMQDLKITFGEDNFRLQNVYFFLNTGICMAFHRLAHNTLAGA